MITVNVHRFIHICLQLLSPVYILCCLHVLSFSQCEYFSAHYCTIVYIQCLHWIFTVTYNTIYNYSPQYTYFAVYICFPFHNVNIFPHITVESSIYNVYIESSLIHTVLFTINLASTLTVLFTFAFLFTMWIFFHSYCIIFYSTMFTVMLHWIHAVLCTITLPSILYVLFKYASFSQCDIFSQLLPNWLYNNVYSISATYTYSTVYNYLAQFTNCAVYIGFSSSQCEYFPQITVQLSKYTMFKLNFIVYIQYSLLLVSTVYILCCLHVLSFSQCEYLSAHYYTIVYIQCLHWIFTVIYNTIYN